MIDATNAVYAMHRDGRGANFVEKYRGYYISYTLEPGRSRMEIYACGGKEFYDAVADYSPLKTVQITGFDNTLKHTRVIIDMIHARTAEFMSHSDEFGNFVPRNELPFGFHTHRDEQGNPQPCSKTKAKCAIL